MKHGLNNKKTIATLVAAFFIVTGTYNAVVINSESYLSQMDVTFVKRLDEVYGVTKSGREVAASINWQKLSKSEVAQMKRFVPTFKRSARSSSVSSSSSDLPEATYAAAAVQEELSLNLTEVINPKKWQQGLANNQFSGTLATNNGVIESLSVSLPGGEGVSVSFSEMTGNVFEYDLNGELYSGMMYQVDQNSYMVTLTNGPLEGTRLRFTGEPSADQQAQTQTYLAENHNVEVGSFGEEPAPASETETQVAAVQTDVQPEVQPEIQAEVQPEIQPEMIVDNQDQSQEAPVAQGFNFEGEAQAM